MGGRLACMRACMHGSCAAKVHVAHLLFYTLLQYSYVKPTDDGNGWMYSDAMVAVLSDYKAQHPWVWAALESKAAAQGEGGEQARLG